MLINIDFFVRFVTIILSLKIFVTIWIFSHDIFLRSRLLYSSYCEDDFRRRSFYVWHINNSFSLLFYKFTSIKFTCHNITFHPNKTWISFRNNTSKYKWKISKDNTREREKESLRHFTVTASIIRIVTLVTREMKLIFNLGQR